MTLLASLSQQLAREQELKPLLIENINKDPYPRVRLHNLRALTLNYPIDEEVDSLLKNCLKDRDRMVVFEAAQHLGELGMEQLIKILERENALLSSQEIHLAITILKKSRYKKSIPTLKKVYQFSKNLENKIAIMEIFEHFQDQSLNDFLVSELVIEDPKLLNSILKALGSCGQITAVEALYKKSQEISDSTTNNLIKETIAKIQSRLEKGDKGWLSIQSPDKEEGALSLSQPAKKGNLSVPPKIQPKKES